jgi:hypothetical protein
MTERHAAPVALARAEGRGSKSFSQCAAATPAQTQHQQMVSTNRALLASENHGQSTIAATPKPGAFAGKGVVAAKDVKTGSTPPGTKPAGAAALGSNPTGAKPKPSLSQLPLRL